jgi:predicted site-specific integrase-resolvase
MNWISENEAAEKVNRKPKTLRALVKSGKWPVRYTAPNNRRYMYDEKGINEILERSSSIKHELTGAA